MYDENNPAPGGDLPELDSGSSSSGGIKGWTHKIFSKAETIIPIILIILFLLFFSISFLHVSPNSIPLIGGFLSQIMGSERSTVLVLGEPDQITLDLVVNSNILQQRFSFRQMDPANLDRKPMNTIKNYDIIMIDQSQSSDKSIPKELSIALKDFVNGGGSLVIVGDSAYKITGTEEFGWTAVLGGSLAPVNCERNKDNTRPCENPIVLQGVLINYDPSRPELEGVDQYPASLEQGSSLQFKTYDIQLNGDEWMTIKDVISGRQYPGLVFKRAGLGKVIYFNYNNIGVTPGLVDRMLTYLS